MENRRRNKTGRKRGVWLGLWGEERRGNMAPIGIYLKESLLRKRTSRHTQRRALRLGFLSSKENSRYFFFIFPFSFKVFFFFSFFPFLFPWAFFCTKRSASASVLSRSRFKRTVSLWPKKKKDCFSLSLSLYTGEMYGDMIVVFSRSRPSYATSFLNWNWNYFCYLFY